MSSLQLERIVVAYSDRTVLNGVDAAIPIGLTVVVGASGSGKSSLLRVVATAERPLRGRIVWEGKALPGGRQALRRALGYAPQAVGLPEDLTACEFIDHLAALKGLAARAAAVQFLALAEALGLHRDVNQRIASFSAGMRRRLVFAQALLGTPRLLVLDEPTAELDAESVEKVETLILERAGEATVIMSTHHPLKLLPQAAMTLRIGEDGRLTAP